MIVRKKSLIINRLYGECQEVRGGLTSAPISQDPHAIKSSLHLYFPMLESLHVVQTCRVVLFSKLLILEKIMFSKSDYQSVSSVTLISFCHISNNERIKLKNKISCIVISVNRLTICTICNLHNCTIHITHYKLITVKILYISKEENVCCK